MSSFDDRERGYEAKFVHDQELNFRIIARRNHLLGVWAGELLGHHGGDLALYAGTVMTADLAEPGDTLCVVGPEGGLTDAEARLFTDAGFVPATLGARVLRWETAALAVLALGLVAGS